MFVQIDYLSFTLLFVELAQENEFGIVKVIYLYSTGTFQNGLYFSNTVKNVSCENTKAFK